MDNSYQYVVFSLDEQLYALALAAVERVVRVAEITPLPKSPPAILGVMNISGEVIPVLNTRRWFGLPEQDIRLADRIIIARISGRVLALVVNAVLGVIEPSLKEVFEAGKLLPDMPHLDGLVKVEQGMLFICNAANFPAAQTTPPATELVNL